jgi:ribosomal-protein-alanine N-acetyltransferase
MTETGFERLTIRPMTLDDLPAVVEIDRQAFSVPWPARSFRFELQDNPVGRLFVAVPAEGDHTDRVLGYIGIWDLVDEGHISTLAVHPEHRRHGIGGALLRAGLLALAATGMHAASLEVRASNGAAQHLYTKFGFGVHGRRRGYYQDNGEDALIMTLSDLTPYSQIGAEIEREHRRTSG